MNIEEFRNYCLQKKGVTEEFPFDKKTLVFKVMGKMFALTGLEKKPTAINLKCQPDNAIELREQYNEILPGFHMNKKHWNTVLIEERLPKALIKKLIDHSYDLVVKSLPIKLKQKLNEL